MKKTVVILSSLVGGAVLGSALTMFMTPKSGADMRKRAHSKIMEQLSAIQETIESCSKMIGSGCSCSESNREEPTAEE